MCDVWDSFTLNVLALLHAFTISTLFAAICQPIFTRLHSFVKRRLRVRRDRADRRSRAIAEPLEQPLPDQKVYRKRRLRAKKTPRVSESHDPAAAHDPAAGHDPTADHDLAAGHDPAAGLDLAAGHDPAAAHDLAGHDLAAGHDLSAAHDPAGHDLAGHDPAPALAVEMSSSRDPVVSIPEELVCVVCMDSLRDTLLPCLHLSTCEGCTGKIGHCPICRTAFDTHTKVFLS